MGLALILMIIIMVFILKISYPIANYSQEALRHNFQKWRKKRSCESGSVRIWIYIGPNPDPTYYKWSPKSYVFRQIVYTNLNIWNEDALNIKFANISSRKALALTKTT